jgi:hypothetical protein
MSQFLIQKLVISAFKKFPPSSVTSMGWSMMIRKLVTIGEIATIRQITIIREMTM